MKYFVVSDIHSCFSELKKSLDKVKFDRNNPEHMLIVCGDIFDRGEEAVETFNFLYSLNKKNCILIKGNHEELYLNLLEKDFPENHDFSNGTVETFCQIANVNPDLMNIRKVIKEEITKNGAEDCDLVEILNKSNNKMFARWKEILEIVKKSKVTKWLKSSRWIDYYELDKYIFVHSFIPTVSTVPTYDKDVSYYRKYFTYNENWRKKSTKEQWKESRWGCPFKQYNAGLFYEEKKRGKILVCGHWSVNDFHLEYENKPNDYSIYYGSNLIAIDGCTVLTKQVNVLVIDNNFNIVKNL